MSTVSSSLVSTGNFCTVSFITNDGEIRTINGRTGVNKYLKGTGNRTQATNNKYFLIYTRDGSPKFNAPRNIAKNRIISIRAHGIRAEKNNNSPYAHNV